VFEDVEHSWPKSGGPNLYDSTVFPSEPLEGNFVRVWTVWIKSRLGTAKVATLRYETSGYFVGLTYLVIHAHLRFVTLEPSQGLIIPMLESPQEGNPPPALGYDIVASIAFVNGWFMLGLHSNFGDKA